MLPRYKNSLHLLEGATKEKLYNALICQLNKDFALVGLAYSFSLDCSPEQLKEALLISLEELISNDFDSFLNLLYRIDIAEKNIIKDADINMDAYHQKIAFVILQRIWKKVWFKNQFSK